MANKAINRLVIEVQNEIIKNHFFNDKVGDTSQIHQINQFRRILYGSLSIGVIVSLSQVTRQLK